LYFLEESLTVIEGAMQGSYSYSFEVVVLFDTGIEVAIHFEHKFIKDKSSRASFY
jgi:hypothetical protein